MSVDCANCCANSALDVFKLEGSVRVAISCVDFLLKGGLIMSKRKSHQSMRKNLLRRIPEFVYPLVETTLTSYPALVSDIYKIVATHSCNAQCASELAEHIIALVAATQTKDDPTRRMDLRTEAFKASPIDANPCKGKKHFYVAEITKVKSYPDGGYDVTMSDGWSFYTERSVDGYAPQVGDAVWYYTVQCSIVLGRIINGHVFKYETLAQHYAGRDADRERRRAEERKKFPERDKRIAKLPEIFQQRIHNFQRAPDFREDLEGYEIFVCEQAVLFAERLKTVDELSQWSALDYDQQARRIPELEDAGHSGNSFGAACCLARAYLENPDLITKMPGALAPLVGSDAYLPPEERSGVA